MINVDRITVRYGATVALLDASLHVAPGRVCGILGTNGSGKTTLFKSLTGAVRPDTGSVELAGLAPRDASKQGLVGYVPQSSEVDWSFPISVRDVVLMGRYGGMGPLRRPRHQDREAVNQALDLVRLSDSANRQIGQLSGGQRKRAFVARALAQGASILLLDEPFAGVDKPSQQTIIDILRQLSSKGATVLVATHDLAAIPSMCDEAALLRQQVIVHATTQEVLDPHNLAKAFGSMNTEDLA